ncbi:unnamed protein product [Cylicocyclus nassatus]|uniref:Uncharacterized protein n=1 Tax=Cylicocyclus nassatus TaxID=53992 RepID=A0AA36GXE4_CYLNA|nr:unnamed protein product [Cylicocyclus nassatus]
MCRFNNVCEQEAQPDPVKLPSAPKTPPSQPDGAEQKKEGAAAPPSRPGDAPQKEAEVAAPPSKPAPEKPEEPHSLAADPEEKDGVSQSNSPPESPDGTSPQQPVNASAQGPEHADQKPSDVANSPESHHAGSDSQPPAEGHKSDPELQNLWNKLKKLHNFLVDNAQING